MQNEDCRLGLKPNVIRKYNSFRLDGELECFFVLLPLTVEVKDIAHSLTESDAECSLGIRDQRIFRLLRRISS